MATKDFINILDAGGLITNTIEEKINDRNASEARNIDFSIAGLLQSKKGWSLVGNKTAGAGVVSRIYTFKKNYGTIDKVILRVRDDGATSIVEWFNASNQVSSDGKWEPLKTGLTTGAIMGFAPANGNAGAKVNLLIMSNAVESGFTWNGATATVASVTTSTIVCNETLSTSGDQEGFTATGNVIIDGTVYAYTGVTAKTLTGVTPDPTSQNPSAGVGVCQDTTDVAAIPKGNVLLVSQRKLWVAGVADNESKVHYSISTDVLDFTITSGLGSGGTFDLMEGGGKVNFMEPRGKNGVVIHKDDAVISYSRTSDGTNVVETFDTIAKADDSGATNIKASSAINNDSYFATGREGLKQLLRTLEGDELQVNSITSAILPTLKDWDFSTASVIYYPEKRAIKMAAKNEDGDRKTVTYYINTGDISIDDETADDYSVKDGKVYMASSIDQNVYLLDDRKSANAVEQEHVYATKSFILDEPAKLKELNTLYVEGLIGEATKIKVTVLYGQLGSAGESSVILSWDDNDNNVSPQKGYVTTNKISALGTDVLGTISLGSRNQEILDSYAFSVPIHIDATTKATRYKIKIESYYDDETEPNGETYWAITTIGANPKLLGIENTKTINTNI